MQINQSKRSPENFVFLQTITNTGVHNRVNARKGETVDEKPLEPLRTFFIRTTPKSPIMSYRSHFSLLQKITGYFMLVF